MHWPDALATWPHRAASQRIHQRPHRWHVQEMGKGPLLLLLHGTGEASHTWRGVLPVLAERFRVIALDLPGHGLTQLGTRGRSGLTTMSEDILALCTGQDWHPTAIIGHSAGGAVALRMAQIAPHQVPLVLGLNPALDNFKGLAGVFFPMMAKALALTPFSADLFARGARRPGRVETLLEGTGSRIDPEGVALYRALVGDRDHIDGTLLMMAQWSLTRLLADMPAMQSPVRFLTGAGDLMVPPETAVDAARKLPDAQVESWPQLGHLMQEEAPTQVADWISAQVITAQAQATGKRKSPPRVGQAS